ncbi:MAG: ShlB/FhaC/HecB family hemolysin secretion/activation protein [Sphingobium sp.]
MIAPPLRAAAPPPTQDQTAQAQTQTPQPAAPAILRAVTISGSSIASALERATRPYVGALLDEARLQALANDLTAAYARSDVAIYTIDLHGMGEDGQLAVAVREGHVERLRFSGLETGVGARVRAVAAPLKQEKGTLSKKRLQRVLRLVQAIPGAQVEATMVAGTEPGGLEIRFHTAARERQLGVLFHNNGQPIAGREQMLLSAQGNSVLRAGDQLVLQGGVSLNGRTLIGAVAYSQPLGKSGLSLDLSAAASSNRIPDFRLEGDAHILSAALSYPLLLNQRDSLTASVAANLQVSQTRLFGYRIFREKAPSMRASLRWRRETLRAISDVMLTASRSIPGSPVEISEPLADRHFTKLEAQVSYDRLIGKRVALRLRMLGQYSPDALAQAEGAFLGGQNYGRAYEPAILIGDSAIAGSMEIAWAAVEKETHRVELFGAVDAARAHYNERPFYNSGRFDLASLGGGVRAAKGGLNTDIGVYRALTRPFPGYDKGWRALVSVGFSFP